MALSWGEITHITKVDPAKTLPQELTVLRDTDLVMVGGSDNVTEANTLETVDRIRTSVPDIPILQEPYSSGQISKETVKAVDYLSIPAVYNGDRDHFYTKHLSFFTSLTTKAEEITGTGLPVVGDLIASKGRDAVADVAAKLLPEGYVIQNLDSKAARVTGVERRFSEDEIAGTALATETFYQFPIMYIEYSGMYGGPSDVEAAAKFLDETVLLYGGGIQSHEQAREILSAGADAIVVGDCFHDDPARFRRTIP